MCVHVRSQDGVGRTGDAPTNPTSQVGYTCECLAFPAALQHNGVAPAIAISSTATLVTQTGPGGVTLNDLNNSPSASERAIVDAATFYCAPDDTGNVGDPAASDVLTSEQKERSLGVFFEADVANLTAAVLLKNIFNTGAARNILMSGWRDLGARPKPQTQHTPPGAHASCACSQMKRPDTSLSLIHI